MAVKDLVFLAGLPTEPQSLSDVVAPLKGASQFYSGYTNDSVPFTFYRENDWLVFKAFTVTTNRSVRICLIEKMGQRIGMQAGKVYYGGMRFKKNQHSNLDRGLNLVWSYSSATYAPLLDAPDINYVNNTEAYIEYRLDFVGKSITFWVDGTKVKNVVMPQSMLDNPAGTAIGWGPTTVAFTGVGQSYLYLKDGYFKEVEGEDDDFRLGPQVVTYLQLDKVQAPGWTSTAGTVMEALATPVSALTNLSQPLVASGSPITEAELSFSHPGVLGSRINAVHLRVIAVKPAGAPGVLGVTLGSGESDFAELDIAAANIPSDYRLGVYPKAPNGSAWDDTKLDTVKVTLRPHK